MLVVVIIFILTFTLIGGVVYFSSKKNEESQMSDSSWSLEPESVPVPSKKDPQVTEKAKETEPEPAPVPKKPDPIDCVGKWGEWSACSAKCGDGTQRRDWITLRKDENGGKACVYDINKDGYKACKVMCNPDVEVCYSCGFKKCKVFKNGYHKIHVDTISSIKVPSGRKVEAWIPRTSRERKLNLTKNIDLCREDNIFNPRHNKIVSLRISGGKDPMKQGWTHHR